MRAPRRRGSQGPAHRPWSESPAPIAAIETGTTRQKARSRKMRPRPARVSFIESARSSRSESCAGTPRRMRSETAAVTAAREMKYVAPARPFEGHLDRRRRRHGPEPAEPHDESVQERPSPARKPEGDGLEGGHEAAREADPDEAPAEGQHAERLGGREDQRPAGRHEEKPELDPARAVSVEEDPERELEEPETRK